MSSVETTARAVGARAGAGAVAAVPTAIGIAIGVQLVRWFPVLRTGDACPDLSGVCGVPPAHLIPMVLGISLGGAIYIDLRERWSA